MRGLVFAIFLISVSLGWAIFDLKYHDINLWSLPVGNFGEFGQSRTGEAGGEWPRGSGHMYIYGAGLWVGAIAPNGDTLVTVGYNPSSGGNEVVPGLFRQGTGGMGSQLVRVYKFPGDWPPDPDTFPMAPQTPLTTQETWCCYNDNNPTAHSPGDTRPIGFDVYPTGFADTLSIVVDVVFLKYEVKNCTTYTMRNTYFGIAMDADVGDYRDDRNGLILSKWFAGVNDTVKWLGYAADWDSVPGWGAVGMLLVKAPRNLGLTAFKSFVFGSDPPNDRARYKSLAGYTWQTGQYEPYDSIDPGPDDKIFLMSSGPFDLLPGQKEELVIAVIGSDYNISDTLPLARRARDAKWFWEHLVRIAEREERSRDAEVKMAITPNPIRNKAVVSYALGNSGFTSLKLYDASGRLAGVLFEGNQSPGNYRLTMPRDIESGVYFIRLTTEKKSVVEKVAVVR